MKHIKKFNDYFKYIIFESKVVGLSNIVRKNILKNLKNYDVYKNYGYVDIRKLSSISI